MARCPGPDPTRQRYGVENSITRGEIGHPHHLVRLPKSFGKSRPNVPTSGVTQQSRPNEFAMYTRNREPFAPCAPLTYYAARVVFIYRKRP